MRTRKKKKKKKKKKKISAAINLLEFVRSGVKRTNERTNERTEYDASVVWFFSCCSGLDIHPQSPSNLESAVVVCCCFFFFSENLN